MLIVCVCFVLCFFFFFKQKTAYEMRISDWSSDVCSSDLVFVAALMVGRTPEYVGKKIEAREVKLAMLAVAVLPLVILGFTAIASVLPAGQIGRASCRGRVCQYV